VNILLVRCTNGIVAWRLSPNRVTKSTSARCLNDAFLVTSDLILDASVVDYLQAIASHSSQLKGAVQTVAQIELPQ